jgi:hypothetical protein
MGPKSREPLSDEDIGQILFQFARQKLPDGTKIVAVFYQGEPLAEGRTKAELLEMLKREYKKVNDLASIIPHKIPSYASDFLEHTYQKQEGWLERLKKMQEQADSLKSQRPNPPAQKTLRLKPIKESPASK